jgi:hypothetical protein
VPVCSHVSSPKVFKRFRWNSVLGICTEKVSCEYFLEPYWSSIAPEFMINIITDVRLLQLQVRPMTLHAATKCLSSGLI